MSFSLIVVRSLTILYPTDGTQTLPSATLMVFVWGVRGQHPIERSNETMMIQSCHVCPSPSCLSVKLMRVPQKTCMCRLRNARVPFVAVL